MTNGNSTIPDNYTQYARIGKAASRLNNVGFGGRRFPVVHYSQARAHEMRALNPWAGGLWSLALMRAFSDVACPKPKTAITLYSSAWSFPFSPETPKSLSDMIDTMKTDASKVLEGVPYLLFADTAIHRTSTGRQQALCYHVHGVAWGGKEELRKRFAGWESGFHGAPGFSGKDIHDLQGWLDYCAKDTRCRYVTNPSREPKGRRKNHHHKERLWGPQLGLLLRAYGDLRKPQLAFGCGIGSNVLKAAKAIARDEAQKISRI